MCIACGAPENEAPDLMAHDEDEGAFGHCYFKKQPSTREELHQAVRACRVSCCGAVQYDGDDPEILRLLAEPRPENPELLARVVEEIGLHMYGNNVGREADVVAGHHGYRRRMRLKVKAFAKS